MVHPLKGRKQTPEAIAARVAARRANGKPWSEKCEEGCTCYRHSEMKGRRVTAAKMGKYGKEPARGYYMQDGYKYLTGHWDYSICDSNGVVAEHRKVLYDSIGPGPHPCHWCGKMLEWGGRHGINADHLDDVKLNNTPENLVPSCCGCNRVGRRRKARANVL